MTDKKQKKEETLSEMMKKIKSTVAWFDEQAEPDIEVGLEKIKEATKLIKSAQNKLDKLENEFKKISS